VLVDKCSEMYTDFLPDSRTTDDGDGEERNRASDKANTRRIPRSRPFSAFLYLIRVVVPWMERLALKSLSVC
jgi:hypothetical protein